MKEEIEEGKWGEIQGGGWAHFHDAYEFNPLILCHYAAVKVLKHTDAAMWGILQINTFISSALLPQSGEEPRVLGG